MLPDGIPQQYEPQSLTACTRLTRRIRPVLLCVFNWHAELTHTLMCLLR